MATITYHHTDGQTETLEAKVGDSVMRTALTNGVKGIVGECGGQAMCATCHVYVRDEHLDKLAEMSEDEEEMLEVTSSERDEERSRLSCQIKVDSPDFQIDVDLPETQV